MRLVFPFVPDDAIRSRLKLSRKVPFHSAVLVAPLYIRQQSSRGQPFFDPRRRGSGGKIRACVCGAPFTRVHVVVAGQGRGYPPTRHLLMDDSRRRTSAGHLTKHLSWNPNPAKSSGRLDPAAAGDQPQKALHHGPTTVGEQVWL